MIYFHFQLVYVVFTFICLNVIFYANVFSMFSLVLTLAWRRIKNPNYCYNSCFSDWKGSTLKSFLTSKKRINTSVSEIFWRKMKVKSIASLTSLIWFGLQCADASPAVFGSGGWFCLQMSNSSSSNLIEILLDAIFSSKIFQKFSKHFSKYFCEHFSKHFCQDQAVKEQ